MPPRPEKRRQMLNAAHAILSESGSTGLSMDALAERAGVSKPTIYTHFGSKAELCRALVRDLTEELVVDLEEARAGFGPETSDMEVVRVLAVACLKTIAGERCVAVYRMMIAEGPRDELLRTEVVHEAFEPTNVILDGCLSRVSMVGGMEWGRVSMARRALFGLIEGWWLIPVLMGVRPPLTEAEIESTASMAATVMCGSAAAV